MTRLRYAAQGEIIPGSRVPHARDNLLDRLAHQRWLILLDDVAALARDREARLWHKAGEVLLPLQPHLLEGGARPIRHQIRPRAAVREDGQRQRAQRLAGAGLPSLRDARLQIPL